MKNVVIIFFLALIVVVLYGLNEEFGWIDLNLKNLAIGVAGGAGPLQYLKNLSDQKNEEKQLAAQRYEYRVLEQTEFIEREKRKAAQKPAVAETESKAPTQELFHDQNALG